MNDSTPMRSSLRPSAWPPLVDIAIVGAGPQALTLVTHLLQKKKSMRDRFVVLDPSGDWLQQWQHQFAAHEILHLRSPAVHHHRSQSPCPSEFCRVALSATISPLRPAEDAAISRLLLGCHSSLEVAGAGDCYTGTEDRTVLSPVFAEVWKDIVIVSRCS